jgi:hypothetical protein
LAQAPRHTFKFVERRIFLEDRWSSSLHLE